MRTLRLVWFVVMVAAAPSMAQADGREAKAAYERGTAAYNLQRFDEALDQFSKAYIAKQDPSLLFNIAQCQRQLRQYEASARSYRAYLATAAPAATNREAVERLEAQMEDAAKEATAHAATPPTGVTAPPVVEPAPRAVELPPALPWYNNPAGWAVAGAGIAGLAVSVGLLVHGNDLNTQIGSATSVSQATQLQHDRDTYRTAGYAMVGVGAALAVTGAVVLGVIGAKRHRAPTVVAQVVQTMLVGGAF